MSRLALALLLCGTLLSGCSGTAGQWMPEIPGRSHLPKSGTQIATVKEKPFAFGALAVGQERDRGHRRSEGLGLVHAPSLTRYLERVLAKLVAESPVSNIPAHVYIRATPSWGAASTADANIYVDLGMLDVLQSEDEVAALLAHELAHIILAHHTSDVVGNVQQQALALSELAVGVQEDIGKSNIAKVDVVDPDILKKQTYVLQLNTAVMSPAWNRGQETEADLLGIDLLVKAGYSRVAMLSLLQKIGRWEDAIGSRASTSSLPAPSRGASSSVLLRYGRDRLGLMLRTLMDTLARRHPSAETRSKDAREYLKREYAAAARPKIKKQPWTSAKAGSRSLFANYKAAFEAEDFLAAGDVNSAAASARKATAGVTSNHGYPRYIYSEVRSRQGNRDKAIANLNLGLAGSEPSGGLYKALSAHDQAAGRKDQAVTQLQKAFDRFGEPASLMPDLIRALCLAGSNERANELVLKCTLDHPTVRAACRKASESCV